VLNVAGDCRPVALYQPQEVWEACVERAELDDVSLSRWVCGAVLKHLQADRSVRLVNGTPRRVPQPKTHESRPGCRKSISMPKRLWQIVRVLARDEGISASAFVGRACLESIPQEQVRRLPQRRRWLKFGR